MPRSIRERELAHLKEMGVNHVSLPPAKDASAGAAELDDVIRIVRRLGLEADLEAAIPDRLLPLEKSHGGPLTQPLAAIRISAIMPRALENERKLLSAGTQAIVWTDVFETLAPAYQPGAIALTGAEGVAAALIRREAQLARFWGSQLSALAESPGARLSVPVEGVSVHQYIADKNPDLPGGLSLATVINDSPTAWKGEVRVMYPALQRAIALPSVSLARYDLLWLPVNVPLAAGSLCAGCTGFAPGDHVAYATAELTGMEYENGILAMEFVAPAAGEVVLQLSHEPPGPLIAAGHPSVFDWDPKTQRARLPIPAGNARTGHVRVALAIDAPPATASFESTPALLIGETNRLAVQFSPAGVAARSRLRAGGELTVTQEEAAEQIKQDQPARLSYRIAVPSTAIAGDVAQLSVEADGIQLSHAQLRVLPSATIMLENAVSVRVAPGSSAPVMPATVPVNRRSGREIVLDLRNNAPEIRTFDVTLNVPGLEFSPEKLTVSVGASVAREISFHVFSSAATPGVHEGQIKLSGAATLTQPVRFVVLPPNDAVAWSSDGFSFLESAKNRASFLGNKWLEMLDKESGNDAQPAGGTVYSGGPVEGLKLENLIGGAGGSPAAHH